MKVERHKTFVVLATACLFADDVHFRPDLQSLDENGARYFDPTLVFVATAAGEPLESFFAPARHYSTGNAVVASRLGPLLLEGSERDGGAVAERE